MDRAYSLLTVKAVDEEKRIIEGIATTPTPDRFGDIVEPEGAEFKLPLPLLWQHNSREPVGHVTEASISKDGIAIEAQFARIEEPGRLQDRLNEAWQSVKTGLVRGLSIGFLSIERAYIENSYSIRFIKWAWTELSCVTIPANTDAEITMIRSLANAELLAASGLKTATPSGAPDQPKLIKPVILREPVRVHPVRVIIPGRKEAR